MYQRDILNLFPLKVSAFLFGPRQTGKSTFLKNLVVDKKINLLESSTFLKYNKNPDLLFSEIKTLYKNNSLTIWIEEIQKISTLLNVVHHVLEEFPKVIFIMSGSSHRKLRKSAANLLGGRALDIRMHPLSIHELGKEFNLEFCLKYGTLPGIYTLLNSDIPLAEDLLDSYVTTYLQDEIKNESILRSLDSFQRFLEVAASQASQTINFSKIADDCLVSVNSVQNYYSILEDTLIGNLLPCYANGIREELTKQPKFYFFDCGVTRAINGLTRSALSNIERGMLFEQFVFNELRKINDYHKKSFKIYLWRTKNGAEVDFLITRARKILLAIEVKSSINPTARDLSGLKAFKNIYPDVETILCAPIKEDILIQDNFMAVTVESLLEKVKKI